MYKKNLFAFVSNDTVTVNLCLLLNLLSGERTIFAVKIKGDNGQVSCACCDADAIAETEDYFIVVTLLICKMP